MSENISDLQYQARRALTLNLDKFQSDVLALLRQNNDATADAWAMLFKANRLRYLNDEQAYRYLDAVSKHADPSSNQLVVITTRHLRHLIDSSHASLEVRLSGLENIRSQYLQIGTAFGDAIVDLQVGYALLLFKQPADALQSFYSAVGKFEVLADDLLTAEAKVQVADALMVAGYDHGANDDAFKQSLQILHEVQNVYTQYDIPEWIIDVLTRIAGIYYAMSDYTTALTHAQKALAICERISRDDQTDPQRLDTMVCLGQISSIHVKARNLDMARRYALESLDMCPDSHHDGRRNCLEKLGVIEIWDGNAELALDYYENSIAHATLHGLRIAPTTHLNVAHCLIMLGRIEEARVEFERVEQSPLVGHQETAWAAIVRAQIMLHDGAHDRAKTTVEDFLQRFTTNTNVWEQIEAHLVLRDVALKLSDLAGYVHHNERVLTLTEQLRGSKTMQSLALKEQDRAVEAEREVARRHKAILYSTLPKHIADRVARGEQVNDHHENATVIFLDIVGFTTISNQLSSSEVVMLLESVFTALDAVCNNHDVVKIKTIGDSYMAVAFGTASSELRVASHEERAANAALDMLYAISHIQSDLPSGLLANLLEDLPLGLQVRLGLHSGPVTAGVIGTERMQYDVWGDTVNVASRMESTSESGRIHVSEAFAIALNGEMAKKRNGETDSSPFPVPCSLFTRGEIEIKGKGLMSTYWLEGK